MHSTSYERSIDATEAAEKILGFYPKVSASDPQIFIAGLVELLQTYPPFVIELAASPTRGLPAKFKFCPNIQEIKETCDEWVDKQREHDRIMSSYSTAAIPGKVPSRAKVREHATASALCERFGIPAVPQGWDAVMVTQQAHVHGANFPSIVEKILKTGTSGNRPLSPAQMVVEQARIAMERRLGEAAE